MYLADPSITCTLEGDTHIYGNLANNEGAKGKSSEIALASTAKVAYVNSWTKPSFKEFDGTYAELVGWETVKESEAGDGIVYTLVENRGGDSKSPLLEKYTSSRRDYWRWHVGYSSTKTEPKLVYLCNDGDHLAADNVFTTSSLEEAVTEAEAGNRIVRVCRAETLSEDNVEFLNSHGITFQRCADHPKGHMFVVSGSVALDGAVIDGMGYDGDSSMVYVPAGASLSVEGETDIRNGNNLGRNKGGDDGFGGGIGVEGGKFTMSGGTVSKCHASYGGGGICVYGSGSEASFEGGIVKGNTAVSYGGGVLVRNGRSFFGQAGGRTRFEANTAYMGGGAYFDGGGEHHIDRADFVGNEATRDEHYYCGGGIYVDKGTTAYMRNVFVSGNVSSKGGDTEGGAVACCPTGNLVVYAKDGLLSTRNGSQPDIRLSPNEQVISGKWPMVYVADTVPCEVKNISLPEDATYRTGTILDLQYRRLRNFALRTFPDDATVASFRATAEVDGVVIMDNRAYQIGSGIMTNGTLVIGTEDKAVRVVKKWTDGDVVDHSNDKVLVYLTLDGEPVSPESRKDAAVTLDASNDWSHVWGGLDPDGDWGFTEAAVPGYGPELGGETKIEQPFPGVSTDKFYERELANAPGPGDTYSLTVSKTAEGLDPDRSYGFLLKLGDVEDGAFALELNGTLYPVRGNEVEFRLKHGESAVVEGLPEGFTYTVTEEEGADYKYEQSEAREGRAVTVSFVNTALPGFELPKTGGTGIAPYIAFGSAAVLLSVLPLLRRRRYR